jgi:two-component sensor histidine kinase
LRAWCDRVDSCFGTRPNQGRDGVWPRRSSDTRCPPRIAGSTGRRLAGAPKSKGPSLELRLSARQALSEHQQELLRRERREDHIRVLLRELTHRSKNLLAVVLAIAQQTAPPRKIIHDYVMRLTARVQGLAFTHDLIADEDWRGVTLDDLAARQLEPFVAEQPNRVQCEGPTFLLTPVAAQNIGLALHELASNAAKYGSLAGPLGSIHLSWRRGPSRLHITWSERDGPVAKTPGRRGFGHAVLSHIVPEALDGKAVLAFGKEGFSWTLDIPASCAL